MSEAGIHLIRGDLEPSLALIDKALQRLDPDGGGYLDVLALRMFLLEFVDRGSDRWKTYGAGQVTPAAGPPRIVSLCIQSNIQWHSGNLFDGLMLNRSAIHGVDRETPVWNLYAQLLLAKKLSDIHIADQAAGVVTTIQNLVDSAGLHAFGALVPSLRSLLDLQAGRYDEALEQVDETVATAAERACTAGVKLALSVAATVYLARNEPGRAAEALHAYHTNTTDYELPDSVARATFAEIALVAAAEGPRAAAEQIRANWRALATTSGCFVEDLTRPSWLVAVARRAGDAELAGRALAAIERLAGDNPGVPLLGRAAGYARSAFEGQPLCPRSVLDVGAARTAPCHDPVKPPGPRTSLGELSEREDEIARLVARGLTNRQVATHLGISPHTVNFHLRRIFRKLSITTRVRLSHLIAQVDSEHGTPVSP
ncbi:helix-turn-helix transcriptional regulator [Kutzneria sp. NPDC051319]|uniref:helix-turn-helix transcriptional regulator n=1 Tax=Kutzneria sp. NPDC051319 TaxID=3155047 RepID=UPI00341BA914